MAQPTLVTPEQFAQQNEADAEKERLDILKQAREDTTFQKRLKYDKTQLNTRTAQNPTTVLLDYFSPERLFSCIYHMYYDRFPAGIRLTESDPTKVHLSHQVLPWLKPITDVEEADPIYKVARPVLLYITAWDLYTKDCAKCARAELISAIKVIQKTMMERRMTCSQYIRLEAVVGACFSVVYNYKDWDKLRDLRLLLIQLYSTVRPHYVQPEKKKEKKKDKSGKDTKEEQNQILRVIGEHNWEANILVKATVRDRAQAPTQEYQSAFLQPE
ncbi:hypothetical protein F5X99DRAFT_431835 [Biscogniauxia marginata]|nr:hypothetical protein F5X99DRAFT_431835 [Biscogniauxia marginata]